jgi:predicted lactoylglutathione lyase
VEVAGNRSFLRSNRDRSPAFAADSPRQVDEFYAAAIAAGGRDNGAPGIRPDYSPGYYGAFVLDPDGNNVEAVHHAT